MSTQAVWRGNTVKVLAKDSKTAIIVTPCHVRLSVRTIELRAKVRERVKKDSRKF